MCITVFTTTKKYLSTKNHKFLLYVWPIKNIIKKTKGLNGNGIFIWFPDTFIMNAIWMNYLMLPALNRDGDPFS